MVGNKVKSCVSDIILTSANEFIDNLFVEFNLQTELLESSENWRFSLGFLNSEESVKIQKLNKEIDNKNENIRQKKQIAVNIFQFYIKCIDSFGSDIAIIPKSQLYRIIKEYNMVCGPITNYTGPIPEELKDSLSKICNIFKYKNSSELAEIKNLVTIGKVIFDEDVKKGQEPYFIYKELFDMYPFYEFVTSYWKSSDKFIKKLNSMAKEDFGDKNLKTSIQSIEPLNTNLYQLLICAPAHEMKGHHTIKTSILRPPKTEDPILFCEGPHDTILCLKTWGEVLTDDLIKKALLLTKKLENKLC